MGANVDKAEAYIEDSYIYAIIGMNDFELNHSPRQREGMSVQMGVNSSELLI